METDLLLPRREIYTGDNLPILRSIDSAAVDLIYLDPPFNSGKQWANPIKAAGKEAYAEFKDTWDLSDIHADHEYIMRRDCPDAVALIDAMATVNGESWKAYLIYMGVRLLEMHRILRKTGSIYYHCDPVMSHGVKLLMDAIFGGGFRNEIVWCYSSTSQAKRDFPRKHDIIFRYAKTDKFVFNRNSVRVPYKLANMPERKNIYPRGGSGKWKGESRDALDKRHSEGKVPEDWWHITFGPNSPERTGYPTQKPLALLERIISVSSNRGDLVLDPFCGCATTCFAAERLGRGWIGMDLSKEAAALVVSRLRKDVVSPLADPGAEVNHLTGLPKRTDLERTENRFLRPRKYERQNGKCAGCARRVDLADLTIDHIIDKKHGGQDEDQNIQLLCTPCNSEKGARGMEYLLKKIAARWAWEQLDELRQKRYKETAQRNDPAGAVNP